MECSNVPILERDVEIVRRTVKFLFVVNDINFFISHRFEIAEKLFSLGYEIHIFAGYDPQSKNSNNLLSYDLSNFKIKKINLSRGGFKIWNDVGFFINLYRYCKKYSPDVLHLITLKPIIYGGIIARILNHPRVVISFTGLGFLFINKTKKINQYIFKKLLRFVLKNRKIHSIFQNKDDISSIKSIFNIPDDNITLIRGSGVNLDKYKFSIEPNKEMNIVMASRILIDKGVLEFIEASKIVSSKGYKCKFYLYGDIDPPNPSAISLTKLQNLTQESKVIYGGFSQNIQEIYSSSNIIVFPSYREGFPKSLIEAAAIGRPIITTDVPGCRDAIINNKTGILVPVKDSLAIAKAIIYLVNNKKLRLNMGLKAREYAEKNLSIEYVIEKHLGLYNNIL